MQVHLLLVSTVILYKFYHRLGAIFLMKDLKDPIERVEKAASLAPVLLVPVLSWHALRTYKPLVTVIFARARAFSTF
jgi:hypothetical protein